MNWTVHGQRQTITEVWDHCEHLEMGDVVPYVVGEQDSFGPLTRLGMCKKCHDKYREEQDEELAFCNDCGQEKPMKEMCEWRWYDFDPSQGDEAPNICEACCILPKHKERVRKDREAYEREMEYFESRGI